MKKKVKVVVAPKVPFAFWLVWRNGSSNNVPRHRHGSEGSARIEAERLASQNPGAKFYVLAASDYAIAPIHPVEWSRKIDADDLPSDFGYINGAPF